MHTAKKSMFTALLSLALLVALGSAISAHHLWLNCTRYNLDIPKEEGKVAETALYFGWGDYLPVHDFLAKDRVKSLKMIAPSGEVTKLEPGNEGFLAVKVKLPVQGTYVAYADLEPTYVTLATVDGKDQHIRKPKTELPAGAQVKQSKFATQTAKTIINLGEVGSQDAAVLRPTGQEFEIVPLKNPTLMKDGDKLTIQVLLKGKPLYGQKDVSVVNATYLGYSTKEENFAFTGTVEEDGTCKVKLSKRGVWQIWVTHRAEAPDDMKDKTDAVTYSATLTFEVP